MRKFLEYLDYAENGSVALKRTISVSPFEQFDSDFELEVCDYLRSKGFAVDMQVGCSGFRIDLGLKLPNSSDYVLAFADIIITAILRQSLRKFWKWRHL